MFLAVIDLVKSAEDCPAKCTCHWDDGKVECSNLNISSLPVGYKNASLVTQLMLGNNLLTTIDKNVLKTLENLMFLDISNNNITELQSETFANMPHISEIVLRGNSITNINTHAFLNLPNLRNLELSKNRISNLQENSFINLTSLKMINFENNKLTELKSSPFLNVPLLSVLFLGENNMSSFPVGICKSVPSLQSLYLDNNNIKSIGEFALDGCSKIAKLRLINNSLQTVNKNAFSCRRQSENKNDFCLEKLTTLFLNENNLTKPPSAFGAKSYVRELDLSKNPLKSASINDFTGLPYLNTLVMSYVPTSFTIGDSAFSKLESLTKLTLTNNRGLKNMSKTAFKGLQNLRYIFLENNSLETLSFDLLNWQNLVRFDARNNKLRCDCAVKWIQDKKMTLNSQVSSALTSLKCTEPKTLKGKLVVNVNPSYFGCPIDDEVSSRVKTGLVVAAIVCSLSIVCLLFIKYRRMIFMKLRMYSYRRHRDDALFTVDNDYSDYSDSQDSSRIRSKKTSYVEEEML